jgi:hypothetical protein
MLASKRSPIILEKPIKQGRQNRNSSVRQVRQVSQVRLLLLDQEYKKQMRNETIVKHQTEHLLLLLTVK